MAAIKKRPQVFQELSQIRSLDEAFQFQVLHPLAEKDIHIFRNKRIKALTVTLKNAIAVRVKGSGKNRSFALEPLLHPLLQFGGGVFREGDRQDLIRLRVSLFNQP